MSFRGAMLLALVACGPGKDPSESEDTGAPEEGEDSGVNTGADSGDTDDETGESGVETGEGEGETGETTETGETGETGETTETGETGGDTGGDTASTSPPVSSRCIEDSDDIGFCTQAKVDMAIDETRKNRQATAVDALCTSRQTYSLIRSGGHNAIAFNHDRAALNLAALAVQDTNLSDGDGHGASLMGMVTMTPPMMSLSL